MTRMKVLIAAVAAFALAASLALVGCGGSGQSSSSSSSASTASSSSSSSGSSSSADFDDDSESSSASSTSAATSTGDEDTYVGTWALSAIMTADGTSQTLSEYAEAQGVSEDDLYASYEFAADGSVVLTTSLGNAEGTWTTTSDGIDVTVTEATTGTSTTTQLGYLESSDGTPNLIAQDASTGISSVFTQMS